MEFAGNPNCVSDLFTNILKSIKRTIKDLWHGASLQHNPAQQSAFKSEFLRADYKNRISCLQRRLWRQILNIKRLK